MMNRATAHSSYQYCYCLNVAGAEGQPHSVLNGRFPMLSAECRVLGAPGALAVAVAMASFERVAGDTSR